MNERRRVGVASTVASKRDRATVERLSVDYGEYVRPRVGLYMPVHVTLESLIRDR